MTFAPLRIDSITFHGPQVESSVRFAEGVNVICGASDTGKSFLAEAIDFMLGGSSLKEIPERVPYGSATLDISAAPDLHFEITRSLAGGNFELVDLNAQPETTTALKQQHGHGRTDNLSGFLLNLIGLSDKRILRSKTDSRTQSLSFRNLARLIIVQEGEIQSANSPFLSGQHTSRTPDLATVKLLLTGVDDSSVVAVESPNDTGQQITLLDELIHDLSADLEDAEEDKTELEAQLSRLDQTLSERRESVRAVQQDLDERISARKRLYDEWATLNNRDAEIRELLARFALLENHYQVDQQRLNAIEESGSLFVYLQPVTCPLCGAAPENQHLGEQCDGNAEAVVNAARAESSKIERLLAELKQTVADLNSELDEVGTGAQRLRGAYHELDAEIRSNMAPVVADAQAQFSQLVEERASVQSALAMFDRLNKLRNRRELLLTEEAESDPREPVQSGIPESAAHAISSVVERILRAWNFPGECRVHFDKQKSDFVIDGKPRGSRGKGLRAITHAAITIALLEYCKERSLPHPGFVVLDSPLLAYFKPEGEEDEALQGSDLKQRFYEYLIQQHSRDSQIIVIENDHPPEEVQAELAMTVFTGNPAAGRFGLL